MRARAVLVVGLALACARPPVRGSTPEGPPRISILAPEYGASPEHPDALAPGERLASLALPLADGGAFELADALAVGPVVLIWLGGAEHEVLSGWVHELDRSLAALEQRGATLVFVRPLEADAALRWAIDLRVQTPVAGDPNGDVARLLGIADDSSPLEFAALVVVDGKLAYRKLGGRRPELAELLAVLDGEADELRCCPGACVGSPCE